MDIENWNNRRGICWFGAISGKTVQKQCRNGAVFRCKALTLHFFSQDEGWI
jgi:hypothetical protein